MRWARAFASWIGILTILAGGVALTVALVAGSLEDPARAVGFVTACIGLLGVGVKGIRGLAAMRRPKAVAALTSQEVDALAAAIRAQWDAEAARRLLLAPAPLPLRWRSLATGGVDRGVPARFAPVPGLTPLTPEEVARGGGLPELMRLHATCPSGRAVLTGPPGSGKSSVAVLLLLETLQYRATLQPDDACKVPVPVLVTLAGWAPATTPFESWFAERVAALHLSGPVRLQQAKELIRSQRVSALLDGLDEVPTEQRPLVLAALGSAPVRVIVFTRSGELAEASTKHRLLDAAVAELCPLEPESVIEYLHRAFPGTTPRGWADFTSCLTSPEGRELAQALANPLTVTLVRDTFSGDDDLTELLMAAKGADGQGAVTNMLLDRLVEVRYGARPGQLPASVAPHRALATLRWIARRMNEQGTRDLAWWRVHEWTSPWPYRLVAVVAVLTWFLVSLFLMDLFVQSADVGWVALILGPPVILSAIVLVLVRRRDRGGIHVPPRLGWGAVMRPTAISAGSAAILGMLLQLLLVLGLFEGDISQVDPGRLALGALAFGAVFGVGAMPVGIAWVLSHTDGTSRPMTPRSSWRDLRRESRIVALLVVLGVWLPFGLAWLVMGVLGGNGREGLWMLGALVFMGLLLALTVGVVRSPTMRAKLSAGQLSLRHHTPLRLLTFLDDAHDRGVLRTVGPVYQFRHAGLQDRLADAHVEQPSLGAESTYSSPIPK